MASRILIVIVLSVFFNSCQYRVFTDRKFHHREGAISIKDTMPKDSIFVFGRADSLPTGAVLMEETRILSPFFWLENPYMFNPYYIMIRHAKQEAGRIGANAVKVIETDGSLFTRYGFTARMYRINQAKYRTNTDSLYYTFWNREHWDRKIEIIRSSNDVKSGGLVITGIKVLHWDGDVGLHIKTYSGETYYYPKNTIWGYKERGHLYRYYPSLITYLQISSSENIIIYYQHDSKSSQYFFSKTLSSAIYRLNGWNLQKVYKDNPEFLSALSHEFEWWQTDFYKRDAKNTGEYRIVEIYRETMKKNE